MQLKYDRLKPNNFTEMEIMSRQLSEKQVQEIQTILNVKLIKVNSIDSGLYTVLKNMVREYSLINYPRLANDLKEHLPELNGRINKILESEG